jgi:hypothetical protein
MEASVNINLRMKVIQSTKEKMFSEANVVTYLHTKSLLYFLLFGNHRCDKAGNVSISNILGHQKKRKICCYQNCLQHKMQVLLAVPLNVILALFDSVH